MLVTGILEILVIATALLFGLFYAFYATFCYWYARRKRSVATKPLDAKDAPRVTIIIPTYNEERVIARRIQNFRSVTYPRDKLQLVFVDGASTDATAEIIERMKDDDLELILIKQREREGFNRAVIKGFKASKGSIVSITGAETEFVPDALLQMVKHFSREDVGAVTGRMITKNPEVLSGKLEKAYRDLYDWLRLEESSIDSCFDIKGEMSAARREVVERILMKKNIATTASIDTCFAFQSRSMGLKVVYEPEAAYYEDAAFALRESFQQTIRRGDVHIEAMLLYKEMYFNPRLGVFGLIIAPAHLAMVILLPLVFGLHIFSLALLVLVDPKNLLIISMLAAEIGALTLSKHLQAFAKIQITMIGAIIRSVIGWETFGAGHTRLESTRHT